MPRITLRDVAAHAGVSHQTVSNVLNGHPSIRSETRERVLSSIQELDYHPNHAAKALREARVTTLCCAFYGHDPEDIVDPYRNLVQSAFTAEARSSGHSVTTAFFDGRQPGTLDDLRARYRQGQFGGAVVVGTTLDAASWAALQDWGLPAVLFDHALPAQGAPAIGADYGAGMDDLVRHHASQGRSRLALVIPRDDGGSSALGRRAGFLAAAERCGAQAQVVHGDWSFASGHAALGHLWDQRAPERPQAVLAGNDRMAAGALRAAHERGLSVPGDVAISGFDDFEFAQYTAPSLTTVRVPYGDMARTAVRALLTVLDTGHPPESRTFRPALVRRESA